MKFLIGPDSFKGSIKASDFCRIANQVIKKYWPSDEIISLPLADGGEGTLEALVDASNGRYIEVDVIGPLFNKIPAKYGLIDHDRIAIIEMAAASGLTLIDHDLRNPMNTTTYGTGQLIMDAIRRGIKHIIVAIGGSATNDGGIGMLQALGYQCLDKNNHEIIASGGHLIDLHKIIPTQLDLSDLLIEVACDVNNPLCGRNGASYVYGKQKGATDNMIVELDKGLKHFSALVKQCLNIDILNQAGAGAAGGLGGGLMIIGGQLQSGFKIISNLTHLRDLLASDVDYVITGEGEINHQSLNGKLPIELAKLAKEYQVPTLLFVGSSHIELKDLRKFGIISVISILSRPIDLDEALDLGEVFLEEALINSLSLLHEK